MTKLEVGIRLVYYTPVPLKVKDIKKYPEYFCVIFKKPDNFHFYAGQYLNYELPLKDPLGNTRSFTISASPTEGYLMLSTRHGKTVFKKALEKIKPGDQIKASHPAGTFTLDEKSPAVMIAGGIGITPFRSMIKDALDRGLKTLITLIYSNSDDDFPFRNDLNNWQKKLKNLKIHYINTSKEGLLDTKKLKLLTMNHPLSTIYYLAGPPKMVDSFDQILQSSGVEKENIRYDHFDGYL